MLGVFSGEKKEDNEKGEIDGRGQRQRHETEEK